VAALGFRLGSVEHREGEPASPEVLASLQVTAGAGNTSTSPPRSSLVPANQAGSADTNRSSRVWAYFSLAPTEVTRHVLSRGQSSGYTTVPSYLVARLSVRTYRIRRHPSGFTHQLALVGSLRVAPKLRNV